MSNPWITVIIKNGPSKFDLAVAFFHKPSTGEGDHILTFYLEGTMEAKVILRGLEMKDGVHDWWNFHGYLVEGEKQSPIKGFFNTCDSTGYLQYYADQNLFKSNP